MADKIAGAVFCLGCLLFVLSPALFAWIALWTRGLLP